MANTSISYICRILEKTFLKNELANGKEW